MTKYKSRFLSLFCALTVIAVSFSFNVSAQNLSDVLEEKTIISEEAYIPSDEEMLTEGEKDATIVEYDDGSEEIIFTIPTTNESGIKGRAVSPISYINVSLSGDGKGNMTAKVWKIGNIGKCSYKIDILYGKERTVPSNTSCANSGTLTSMGGVANPTTLTKGISTTKYFRVRLSGTYFENKEKLDYYTYNILFNKKANRYPDYTCPKSGKLVNGPYYTDFPKTTSIAWNGRNAYVKWFNDTYNNGKDPWNWKDYEIHHIRPRGHGGTNEYANLIPLKKIKTSRLFNLVA